MRPSDEVLMEELHAMRPAPSPEFAARLDRRALEGFPRKRRLRSLPSLPAPRRLVGPAGAVALLAVVVGVGISQLGGGERTTVQPQALQGKGSTGVHTFAGPRTTPPAASESGGAATSDSVQPLGRTGAAGAVAHAPVSPAGRRIAQRVDLQLATSPDDFRDAADRVLQVVRDHRGFVARSNVSSGDPGVSGAQPGRATFELRIPAGELAAAMGDLSGLGHVVSRTDGSLDITKRFVSANQRIADLSAARDRLLLQLGQATTTDEKRSIRARLRIVRAQLIAARHDLAKAQQRVHLVPVSVTITGDSAVAGGGSWTIGDAWHDAGRILTVAAGVALLAGAALLPLALLAALAAITWRRWTSRQRERALDAPTG